MKKNLTKRCPNTKTSEAARTTNSIYYSSLNHNKNEKSGYEGLEILANELKTLDPVYYEQVDIQNTQRVLRALEVCISTGQPFSSFRKNQKVERPFKMIKIALERPREELYARINKRMDIMLANGLEAEAKYVMEFREHYALKTVGYREIYEHLDGEYDHEEMVRLLKRNSRRYAKRQMTWFKNQDEFHWLDAKNEEKIISFVRERINHR